MISNMGYAAAYYVDVVPEDFGHRNSTYLVVSSPMAIDFEPKPNGHIDNGFYSR